MILISFYYSAQGIVAFEQSILAFLIIEYMTHQVVPITNCQSAGAPTMMP